MRHVLISVFTFYHYSIGDTIIQIYSALNRCAGRKPLAFLWCSSLFLSVCRETVCFSIQMEITHSLLSRVFPGEQDWPAPTCFYWLFLLSPYIWFFPIPSTSVRLRAMWPLCSLRTAHLGKLCLPRVLFFPGPHCTLLPARSVVSSLSCLLISMNFYTMWLPKDPFCPFYLGF